MSHSRNLLLTLLSALLLAFGALVPAGRLMAQTPRTFEVGKGHFLLDGKPFVVRAAELHYPRIPRPYWEQRIKLCKALGMNTICLYVFWNAHEERPGEFDFTGQNDLAEFCRLCRKNDMLVILRPGPYVCAEWEMGGLPWWLLKKKDIDLRHADPYFIERVTLFEKAVAAQVAGLTAAKGGPIIMVQVENEYGAYDNCPAYVAQIRDIVRAEFGDVVLFQCDWASTFRNNGLDDLVWTMNFGAGADIDSQFAELRKVRPDSPLMCSEYWSGWFDKWGAGHETRTTESMIAGIRRMLSQDISFSLYMTHGGTNWGHWAGANNPPYAPDVTSYDYDAPISESGQTTPKYWALREALADFMQGEKQAPVPPVIRPVAVPEFRFTEVAPLFDNLPAARHDRDIRTMEDYDQGFGSILYSTTLPELKSQSLLTVDEAHDFAQIFVDGKFVGKLDRRLAERTLTLPPCRRDARLDILVEAMGRVNFGWSIKDYKGITKRVELTTHLDGRPFTCDLKEWDVRLLPDTYEFYNTLTYKPLPEAQADSVRTPGCYRATFRVKKPSDTFLNFETWGKGLVYVNGHPLGRIWKIGPQQTLYVPGCWLRKGENEVLVFDVVGPRDARSEGLTAPIIDRLQVQRPATHDDAARRPELSSARPTATATLPAGNGWREVGFSKPSTGRYVCLEILGTHDAAADACIAELYLLDSRGERLNREAWSVYYADSEEVESANHAADKIFDLQESTYWSARPGAAAPHFIVLDLGSTQSVGGLQLLPRMEQGAPGSVQGVRVYVADSPFGR